MNYRIHQFANDLMALVQKAVDEGVPVYVIPYILKDAMTTLAPVVSQAVRDETPTSEPVGEPEWHQNEESEGSE